jgi:hypothetical protein
VYDSGTSLWYNTQHVGLDAHTQSKPFRKDHAEQIKLVTDLSWFDHSALVGLEHEILEIFSVSENVDEPRRAAIGKAVVERVGQIERLQREHKSSVLGFTERISEKGV